MKGSSETPKYLLLPAVLILKGDSYDREEERTPGTLMREIRDHWREEEI